MICNLGYTTDFIFHKEEGEIIEKLNYSVVRTPSNPTFFYGNYLLFKDFPMDSNKQKLEELFKKEFNDMPKVKHITLCWEGGIPSILNDFTDAGYKFEQSSVLVLNSKQLIKPSRLNQEIKIKKIQTQSDWESWIALEVESRDPGLSLEGFLPYIEKRKDNYKRLSEKKRGNFFGAFMGPDLVASMGLFHEGDVGRFQQVVTKRAFRRKGICTTLLYEVCKIGFSNLSQLVIVADINYHAMNLYKDLGFEITASQSSLCLWNPELSNS